MYCPRCATGYRDGFLECAFCGVPLAPGKSPRKAAAGDSELITVLETNETFALTMAKSTLEEAGILYVATAVGDPESPQSIGTLRIQVPGDCKEEALALLEPLLI